MISANFTFWQRGHTTPDAKLYMNRYHVQESMLPHIGLLDPRTGLLLESITGFRTAEQLSSQLVEFMDKHEFESAPSSTQSTPQQQTPQGGTPQQRGPPATMDHVFSGYPNMTKLIFELSTITHPHIRLSELRGVLVTRLRQPHPLFPHTIQ